MSERKAADVTNRLLGSECPFEWRDINGNALPGKLYLGDRRLPGSYSALYVWGNRIHIDSAYVARLEPGPDDVGTTLVLERRQP